MGRISRHFIDDLISRTDIVELIDSYVPLRKAGNQYVACCPFHTEKTPSFTVSAEKQFYYCFGCGVHGNAIGFLLNYAQLDFVETIHELASRIGLAVVYEQSPSIDSSTSISDDLYQVMSQSAQYYKQQLRYSSAAKDYLKKNRGLTGEIARDFGLGYAPIGWDNLLKTFGTDSDKRALLLKVGLIKQTPSGHCYDRFRDRIMFPILDRRGRVIAFGGRLLHQRDNEPKYLNSPETTLFQKGRELYGLSLALKKRPLKEVIVVEGYMDVISLVQYGIRNVVATLGTATTSEQLNLLFKKVSDVIFCFDGDEAGRKAAWKALETALSLLSNGRQIKLAFLPQNTDPDTLIRQQGVQSFQTILNQAQPLSDFLFETFKQHIKLDSPEGQARLREQVEPLLKQLPEGLYRELMWQKLDKLTGTWGETPRNRPTVASHHKKYPQRPMNNSIREWPLAHQAIICLLHKPELSQLVDDNQLSGLNQKEVKLLREMIQFIKKNPQLKLGTLYEHWQRTEHEQTINQLAQQSAFFTADTKFNIDSEFFSALERLLEESVKQRLAFLLSKKSSEWSLEEKREIQFLCARQSDNQTSH